ncbi:MAG: ribosomal protein S18-alanine N-acetyltransferase [Granulosicoccus sp.]|nr:ribosomal protein S18-alanine N-acetyltransferase [Granulosicoccus sp.]
MSSLPITAEFRFAPMYLRHVALVGTIERRNYEFSWSDGIFRDCLKAGYLCQRALLDDELIGYGILQVAADEAHILNLCIDKPYQRQGFARLLLEHLMQQAGTHDAQIIFLEVRPSNPRAIALYQQSGFNEIGLRKNYYEAANGREDALVMARNLVKNDQRMLRH